MSGLTSQREEHNEDDVDRPYRQRMLRRVYPWYRIQRALSR